jgi:ferredoxin
LLSAATPQVAARLYFERSAQPRERRPQETKVAYIITEPCIGTKDASCVEVCPVDCIYEGGDQYYIHPDECIDCGACEPECPVQAIFPDTDVPPEWTNYIEKNKVHFD